MQAVAIACFLIIVRIMATVEDVAKAAGVSTATVSRTLSHPDLVKAATKERVLEAIARLDFSPNSSAKSLRTTRTSKILVTVPNVSNPFFSSVLRGVEDAAQEAGYSVLLGDTHGEASRENEYGAMLRRKQADGLIFLGHRLPETIVSLVEQMGELAPIVNGCEFNPELDVPSVHIDNKRAAEEAMSLIYETGHVEVGLITGTLRSPLSRDRLAGARAAARHHGQLERLTVASGDFSIHSGVEQATALMAAKPEITAIFCFSDEMAMGALSAVRAAGRVCPDDVSVVGFDDIRFAEYLDPPLTTVSQPMLEIGRGTIGLLLRLLAGEAIAERRVTLPHRIVRRASLAPPRARRAA